jgi:hypothetical protein
LGPGGVWLVLVAMFHLLTKNDHFGKVRLALSNIVRHTTNQMREVALESKKMQKLAKKEENAACASKVVN